MQQNVSMQISVTALYTICIIEKLFSLTLTITLKVLLLADPTILEYMSNFYADDFSVNIIFDVMFVVSSWLDWSMKERCRR